MKRDASNFASPYVFIANWREQENSATGRRVCMLQNELVNCNSKIKIYARSQSGCGELQIAKLKACNPDGISALSRSPANEQFVDPFP